MYLKTIKLTLKSNQVESGEGDRDKETGQAVTKVKSDQNSHQDLDQETVFVRLEGSQPEQC